MDQDDAAKYVHETLKALVTIGGVLLTIIWGVLGRQASGQVLAFIRIGSVLLFLSIVAAILGLQFIVTETERRQPMTAANRAAVGSVTRELTVSISFLISWLLFLIGIFFTGLLVTIIGT